MTERDRLERLAVARAANAYCRGAISRRRFLGVCAQAGFCLGGMALLPACDRPSPANEEKDDARGPASATSPGSDQRAFLRDVGRSFKGSKIKVTTEATPPSVAIKKLVEEEFTPLTGIEVEWELLLLEKVLAKITQDTALELGAVDLFYLDQAWLARFAEDTLSLAELLAKTELAYPGYDFDDFLPPLVDKVASYRGRTIAVPYDIPIFITMYRKDIFEELGLLPPATMQDYLAAAQAINDAMAPSTYGTTGQWKSGHYALECNMTAWLWGHGGSIFAADGSPSINDDRAVEAMEYMLQLGRYMPPGATSWDWFGESASFAEGNVGFYTSWGEFFPVYDDPEKSRIVGLAEPALCPAPVALRPPEACGFGETPGVSHQGGSSMAISRFSKNPDAAWIFLQWATSPDITTRASIMGGGATPIRYSNYQDPRILERARVTKGTTRHFAVTYDAIMNHMGTEPHFPAWSQLAVESFAIELGKLVTGQQSIRDTVDNMAAAARAATREA